MAIEIEKKFLIDLDSLKEEHPNILENPIEIKQGYIAKTEDNTVVRVRIANKKGFLTIKGANIGCSRPEFEYEIPYEDALTMLNTLCTKKIIKKRYLLNLNKHTWEIDIFEGKNKGLIIAEIELTNENELFEIPKWIKKEVTNDKKYYNSNLLENE